MTLKVDLGEELSINHVQITEFYHFKLLQNLTKSMYADYFQACDVMHFVFLKIVFKNLCEVLMLAVKKKVEDFLSLMRYHILMTLKFFVLISMTSVIFFEITVTLSYFPFMVNLGSFFSYGPEK